MNNFYQVISATEKKDLDSIEFPCTVIVGEPTEEARQEAIDDMSIQISQLWGTGFSNIEKLVDNQTARHESYSPHLIRDTATDTNVGTKRTPLDDLVDEIDELYPIEETRQTTIRKKALRKILERYFSL